MPEHTQVEVVSPERSGRRPGRLIVLRSAGGRGRREQTSLFRQVRVLVVGEDGAARILALRHERGAGSFAPKLRHLIGAADKEVA